MIDMVVFQIGRKGEWIDVRTEMQFDIEKAHIVSNELAIQYDVPIYNVRCIIFFNER